MKQFIGNGDPSSKAGFALAPADYVDAAVLSGTAQEFTVPPGARYVVFAAAADFYAAFGSAPVASVPSASVTDGTASELNPSVRLLDGVEKISLIGTAIVTLSYYS